ncbi:MAG TPA: hypothetical protein VF802_09005 [Candidatus Limnocylindrales bacterium]
MLIVRSTKKRGARAVTRTVLLPAVVALATALLPGVVARAAAASMPSNYTYSIYVTSTSGSDASTAGCNLATKVNSGLRPLSSFVILDFGTPYLNGSTWGTYLLGGTGQFVSTTFITNVTEDFGAGFHNCLTNGSASLRLAPGENDAAAPDGKHYFTGSNGTVWGGLVVSVNNWLASYGAVNVTAAAAVDVEPSWYTPATPLLWGSYFSAASGGYAYYNFGSADGCPYGNGQYTNLGCNNSWNQYDLWDMSWGIAAAWPAPEDYNNTYYTDAAGTGNVDPQSRQWENISRYGYHYQSTNPLYVQTVTTQWEACHQVNLPDDGTNPNSCYSTGVNNTQAQGDGDMFNAMNNDWAPLETGQSIQWATDMEWGYTLS